MKFDRLFKAGTIGDSASLVTGALFTLAFAPFGIFPLAILAPALLLGLWLKISPQRAFLRGWLFGVGFFGTGVSWVFISIHTYGNASAALATLITVLFVAILGLFPAINGYLLNRYFPYINDTKILCAFPAIWVLVEWVRSWILSGFPWLFAGTSQIISPLRGYASILSVYGVSLAVVLSSGLLVNILIRFKQEQRRLAYYNLLILILIWIIGGVLSFISWTKPDGTPIKVSLVQGNIPQEIKWSADQVAPTLARYKKLSEPHWDSKIIVWPEAAIPVILQDAIPFLDSMSKLAKKHHATLITGIPIKALQQDAYYNAVITLGEGNGLYIKHRLVPFGEYTPMSAIFSRLLDSFNIPMSNMIPGPITPKPLEVDGIKIATFICYEITFPEQVLNRDGNIGMVLVVSNDAWFGRSIAQAQHLESARFRALEIGRPVLFVANDGITAIINARGKIQAAAPPYQPYVLTGSVQPMKGKTPWQQVSMDPILIILLGLLFIAIRNHKK